ncbi:MAG: hypothetical protein RL723_831 [Actinomycetota bacterium]
MSFAAAIGVCFKKYLVFRGVASRREYWYFVLFTLLVGMVVGVFDQILFPAPTVAADALAATLEADPANLSLELLNAALLESFNSTPIGNLTGLIYGIPLFTAMVRRMRDSGFGAWWLLLSWLPFFTFVVTLLPSKSKTSPSGSV